MKRIPAMSDGSNTSEVYMDFLFFFAGIAAVACALTYLKLSSPNKKHD